MTSFHSGSCKCCRYTTYAIGVASEVVALLIVGSTVDRLGRRNIVAFGQLLGGSACLACAMVNGHIAQAVLAGIGKLGSSGELHCTLCRAELFGCTVRDVCASASPCSACQHRKQQDAGRARGARLACSLGLCFAC